MSSTPSHQTLRRMTYFAAIAEAGSIRRAAVRLGLSTPVMSEALSELEAELGVTLAHRTTRRFALTDAGETVRRAALDMLSTAQRVFALKEQNAPLTGRVALTLPVELSGAWLAARLAPFVARHPRLDIAITATDSMVALGESGVDVAIRTVYAPPGADPSEQERLSLICVARAPVALTPLGPGRLRLEAALLDHRPGATLLGTAQDNGEAATIEPQRVILIDNRSSAIALVKAGLGACLIVEQSAREDLAAGPLARIAPHLDFGSILLDYVYRDPLPSPAARALVAHFQRPAPDGALSDGALSDGPVKGT